MSGRSVDTYEHALGTCAECASVDRVMLDGMGGELLCWDCRHGDDAECNADGCPCEGDPRDPPHEDAPDPVRCRYADWVVGQFEKA